MSELSEIQVFMRSLMNGHPKYTTTSLYSFNYLNKFITNTKQRRTLNTHRVDLEAA